MSMNCILGRATALVLLLPIFASCATQKQLQEYEDEIARLRTNNSELEREKTRLSSQLDAAEARLTEANIRLEDLMSSGATSELEGLGIGVGMRDGLVVISVPSSITFASGSANLSSNGQNAVAAVARVLKSEYPDSVYWIEGHTDTQQPSKSKFDSNRQLSLARAQTVLDHLVNQCGIPDANCVVAGHGEYAPVDSNNSAEGMSRNRRVEIVVHSRQN
jgi:chemotaxis protein MotB